MGLWRVGEKSEAVVVVLGHVVVGKMKWRDVQVEWEGKLGTGEKEGWMVVQEWYCCGEKNQPWWIPAVLVLDCHVQFRCQEVD